MGIHNSSIHCSERRVVNLQTFQINMKAFMTACAVLASSANADPNVINMVNLDHTISHPGLISPYNVVPVNQVSYNNEFGYDLTHPLSTYSMPTYGVATSPTHHFIKREAKLESPYVIKSKMDNPIDGSEQEVQIEVDSSGKGQSFQYVEQKDQHDIMRHNYIMEHRRMAQRPIISKMYLAAPRGMGMNHYMGMNQMRPIDRHQIAMGRNQVDMYGNQQLQSLKEQQESLAKVARELHQLLASRDVLGTQGGQSIQVSNTQQGGIQQGGTQQGANMNQMNIDQLIDRKLNDALKKHISIGDNWLQMANGLMESLKSHDNLGQNLKRAKQLYQVKYYPLGEK